MAVPDRPGVILLVDADEPRRQAAARILRGAGHEVAEAVTGEEALQRSQEPANVVLLDQDLPDLEASEVCRRLRADEQYASPAIVHLGSCPAEPADAPSGDGEGADAYLTHPVRPRELLDTVRTMLRLSGAERRASQRAHEWRRTFDAMPDAVAIVDPSGTVTHCNAAWRELMSVSDEAGPARATDLLLDRLGIEAPVELCQGGRQASAEVRGAGRWFRVTQDPMNDEGAVLMVRDVTEGHRVAEELRASAQELARADERKDELLAMLAHELRTPLGALSVASEVLEELGQGEQAPDSQEEARVHAAMRRQVANLSRMVDDLLDVSRITQGKVHLRRKRVDLNSCVQHVIDSMGPAIRAGGHQLVVRLPQRSLVSHADPTRVEQIASNLIDNAMKYTPSPGRITVEGEEVVEGGVRWGELRVSDTGAGIPEARLSEVFNLFVQFDRTLARSRGGLGLGLTLVRRLVELHDGEVEARSPGAGKGSTFVVRFPLLDEAQAEARSDAKERPAAVDHRRLLLVEDNEDLRQLLAWKLRRRGYDVLEAGDGVTALELARAELPDVALVDLGLPRMDGLELARELRQGEGTQAIRLIALTGYGAMRDLQRTREAGFSEHLVKPVDVDELLARL